MGSASRIQVRSTEPVYIAADRENPVEVLNAGPHDCFHKNAKDVDNGDTKLESGKTVELTEGAWFVTAAATTEINVREMDSPHVGNDLTVAGTASVGGKLHAEGEVEIEGELNHDGAKAGFLGQAPAARPKKKAPAEITAKEIAEALETLGLLEH